MFKFIQNSLKPALLTALISGVAITPVYAENLKSFSANFEVEALGMTLGLAKQKMQCQDNTCILTNNAKPSGLAALLSSDSSLETVRLKQQDGQLKWISYHKKGFTKKDGKPYIKDEKLVLKADQNKIIFLKNDKQRREWQAVPKAFDSISLAYAIQHAKLNGQSIADFVIQDSQFQDRLNLSNKVESVKIRLAKTDKAVKAEKYRLVSEHVKIDLWLLPTLNYFPGKIRIVNQHDKTITLSLSEPPKYYEAK